MTIPANIFGYRDFRVFLKDVFAQKKSKNPRFTLRAFVRLAGLSSHGHLSMVMMARRNMSLKMLKKVARHLSLSKRETDYFAALALYNQADNEQDKDYYFGKMLTLKPLRKMFQLEKDRFAYFTNHQLVVIREMIALPHFEETPEWIAQALGNSITAQDVKKAISILLRLGLAVRDEKGRLIQSRGALESPVDAEALEIVRYHRQVLGVAKEAITTVPHDKREIISITIPLADAVMPRIKEILRGCRDEIVRCVNHAQEKNFAEVYQVNMQCVPVTKTRKATP